MNTKKIPLNGIPDEEFTTTEEWGNGRIIKVANMKRAGIKIEVYANGDVYIDSKFTEMSLY